MVRKIRDEISAKLEGKSDAEVLAFFNDADRRFRKEMGLEPAKSRAARKRNAK